MELLTDTLTFKEALPNGKHRVTGEAIHPCKTYHPQEWGTIRRYVEPYLESAAPSLVGKPLVIDHSRPLSSNNRIIKAVWDKVKSALLFEAEVTDEVFVMFQSGQLKPHVSVGVDWQKPGGGVVVGAEGEFIPYSFDFSELSFISQNSEPGDPLTTLRLWETIAEKAKTQSLELPPSAYSAPSDPLTEWFRRLNKARHRGIKA